MKTSAKFCLFYFLLFRNSVNALRRARFSLSFCSWPSSQASPNKFLRHSKFTNKTVDRTSIAFFHLRNVTFGRLRFSQRIAGRFLLLFWRSHSFKQLRCQLPINCEISYNVIEGNCPHVSVAPTPLFQARSSLFRPFSQSPGALLIDYIPWCVCCFIVFTRSYLHSNFYNGIMDVRSRHNANSAVVAVCSSPFCSYIVETKFICLLSGCITITSSLLMCTKTITYINVQVSITLHKFALPNISTGTHTKSVVPHSLFEYVGN